ncbi:Flp pilus assembly protein CpaB [Streptomyces sp. NPDC089919]|uniref:Flp pilus assembly protein CpaB n=1 Tax=Streptomyces sp. NPDC089919 TaxID=3155188 RepID=UPI00343A003D
MNSRQRRGVILLVLSVLCALAAFAGVLTVIGDVNSKVGPEVVAYRVRGDIAPYTELEPGQFQRVKIPKRWLPDTAVTDLAEVRGKTVLSTLQGGSLLQRDAIVDRPALKAGEQEIAIMIDASTGVAGKIRPGDKVNIIGTYKAKRQTDPDIARVMVTNARVLNVGKLTPLDPKDDSRQRDRDGVPITFALGIKDAERVAFAESFAVHVRLTLLAPGTETQLPPSDRTYTLEGDK